MKFIFNKINNIFILDSKYLTYLLNSKAKKLKQRTNLLASFPSESDTVVSLIG